MFTIKLDIYISEEPALLIFMSCTKVRQQYTMGNRQGKNRKTKTKSRSKKQKLLKGRKRGAVLMVKANDDSYEKVFRAMRTNPELKQLGADAPAPAPEV